MKPVRTNLTDTTFKLPGGTEENDLPVTSYAKELGGPCHGSTWRPTDEERAAIANGSNVELIVFGEGHPPVAMRLSDYQLDDNQWAPDANLHERVERLKRQRAERCAVGQHDDPDNSGMCINCGADLDWLHRLQKGTDA